MFYFSFKFQVSGFKTCILHLVLCIFLLATCNLHLATIVHAQDNRPFITDNDQFNYASFLLKQGHFSAAAREFGRVIEQFPSSPHIPTSQYMIAESYFKAGRYNDAIKEFTQFASNFPDNKFVTDAIAKKDVLQIKLKESTGFPQPISNIKFENLDFKIKAAQVLLFKGKTYEEVEQEIAKLKYSGINTIIVRVFHNKGDRFHPFVNSSEKIQAKTAADAVNKPVPEGLPSNGSIGGFNRGSVKTEFVPLESVKEDGQRIREFLNKWRESWEGKRLDDYMSCYSKTFKARGMDWNAWERYKTSLNKINSIRKVLISDIKILKQDDNHYAASFVQRYIGEDTNDTGIKKLYIEIGDDIKIIGEEWSAVPEEKHPARIAEKPPIEVFGGRPKIEAGVYFETKNAPVVEDMLGRITEFSHKHGLKIFAWMTTRYADYGIEDKIDLKCKSYDFGKNKIVPCKGLDLFNEDVVKHLENIYKDLARYDIDGILFQDDLYLKHNEGFGQYASALYLMDTGKPLEPAALYNGIYNKDNNSYGVKYYTPEFWEWAGWKNKRLLNVAKRLMQTVKEVNPKTRFAINLMYESASNPVYALAWLSQNLDNAVTAGFDYYAIMAYHLQMQDELKKEPSYIERLIENMTREAVERVGSPSKVIMKVQTVDWNTSKPLPDKEVLELLKRINNVNNVSLAVVPYRMDFPFNNIGEIGK